MERLTINPASTIAYFFLVTPKLVISDICKAWLNLSGRDRIRPSLFLTDITTKYKLSKIGYDGQSSPPSFGRPSLPEFTDDFRLSFHEVSFLVCLFPVCAPILSRISTVPPSESQEPSPPGFLVPTVLFPSHFSLFFQISSRAKRSFVPPDCCEYRRPRPLRQTSPPALSLVACRCPR